MNENEMKTNKNGVTIFISIAIAIILLAVVGGTIFCIKTCNLEPAPTEFSMVGVWKMYTRAENFENDDSSMKYLEFSEKSVKVFAVDSTTPSLESKYTLDLVGNKLNLTDANLSYQILGRYVDNYIAIAENEFTEYVLVRANDKALNGDYSNRIGEWKGLVKDKKEIDQKVVITNGNIALYEKDATTPYVNAGYTITSDGIIDFKPSPTALALRYEIAYLSENMAILVELGGTGKNGASVFILQK